MSVGCKQCGLCCSVLISALDSCNGDVAFIKARKGIIRGLLVLYPSPCSHLGHDMKCRIYEKRPQFCKEFPKGNTMEIRMMGCKYFEE